MPSKTARQARFMRACSSKGRSKVKKKCPPKAVAKKYVRHDRKSKRKGY